jgi:transposase
MNRKPKRFFDAQFKEQAVQLALSSGRPVQTVAHELGISHTTLQNWIAAHQNKQKNSTQLLETAQLRIKHLEQQLERVSNQRDILKKSLGIFIEEPPPKNMPKSN